MVPPTEHAEKQEEFKYLSKAETRLFLHKQLDTKLIGFEDKLWIPGQLNIHKKVKSNSKV